MKTPAGFVGHVRDIVKGNCVRDPDVRFSGPLAKTRVFLRTDGEFAVTIDHGEDSGAARYETKQICESLSEAKDEARVLAGVKL